MYIDTTALAAFLTGQREDDTAMIDSGLYHYYDVERDTFDQIVRDLLPLIVADDITGMRGFAIDDKILVRI